MKYSTAALLASAAIVSATPTPWGWGKDDHKHMDSPFEFTSTYMVHATPDQVVTAMNAPAPGQPGAMGYFNYGINSHLNTICYNITLMGVTGDYQSMAKTATHIHEAAYGMSGPPRLAFPNPMGDDHVRRSVGCIVGPFTTGVLANGVDTGTGFHVSQIEENPAGFFTDAHTAMYVPGVVRGQLG